MALAHASPPRDVRGRAAQLAHAAARAAQARGLVVRRDQARHADAARLPGDLNLASRRQGRPAPRRLSQPHESPARRGHSAPPSGRRDHQHGHADRGGQALPQPCPCRDQHQPAGPCRMRPALRRPAPHWLSGSPSSHLPSPDSREPSSCKEHRRRVSRLPGGRCPAAQNIPIGTQPCVRHPSQWPARNRRSDPLASHNVP